MQAPQGCEDDQDRLLLRMKEGDPEAFRRLYEQTARTVYAYALSIVRNVQDAEEVMQDAYLAAWRRVGSYSPGGKPMAWLFTITRNLCYGRLRRQRSHPCDSLEALREQDVPWEPADEDPDVERFSERQAILDAMGSLEEEERRIVLLHVLASLKHREIAALLGLPLSTVLSRYSRAIRKLRRELS